MARKEKHILLMIPVFNEETTIQRSTETLLKFLNKNYKNVTMVIADNASTDGTKAISEKLAIQNKKVKYYFTKEKGRGAAIKSVIKNFDADVYAYMDVDLPIEVTNLKKILDPVLEGSCDLTVVKRISKRPLTRRLLTKLLHYFNLILFEIDLADVQSGAKAFNKDFAKQIVADCKENNFWMDTEFTVKGAYADFKIKEITLKWIDKRYENRDSKVKIFAEIKAVLKTIWRLAKSIHVGFLSKTLLLVGAAVLYIGTFFLLMTYNPVWINPLYQSIANLYNNQIFFYLGFMLTYWLIWKALFKYKINNISTWISLYVVGAIVITLAFLTNPSFSQDYYYNLINVKGYVLDGLNPYFFSATDLSKYPIIKLMTAWQELPLVSGPLILWILYIPAKIENVTYGIIAAKTMFLAAILISLKIITGMEEYKTLATEQKQKIWFLYLLNPLLLLSLVVDTRIDAIIVLFTTLVYYAIKKNKYLWAFVITGLMTMLKYYSVVFVPGIFVLFVLDKKKTLEEKLEIIYKTLLVLGPIGIYFLYRFFAAGIYTRGISYQYNYSHLLSQSPIRLFFVLAGVPEPIIMPGAIIVGVAFSLYFASKKKIELSLMAPVLSLLFIGSAWVRAWYFLWLIPMAFFAMNLNLVFVVSLLLVSVIDRYPVFTALTYITIISSFFAIYKNIRKSTKTLELEDFDKYAVDYETTLNNTLDFAGGTRYEYTKYKIENTKKHLTQNNKSGLKILDFGCGDGYSTQMLIKAFPQANVYGVDPSKESINTAIQKCDSKISFEPIEELPLPHESRKFDLIFISCVFHHIPREKWVKTLRELKRILKDAGQIHIYEHNPLNPLTQKIVRECPFDIGVELIRPNEISKKLSWVGLNIKELQYTLFIPRMNMFKRFYKYEKLLKKIPYGAQYCLIIKKQD